MERQAGGKTRGMGEKQIEVDKRLLRLRMAQLRRQIEEVSCSCKCQPTASSVLYCTDTSVTLLLMSAVGAVHAGAEAPQAIPRAQG